MIVYISAKHTLTQYTQQSKNISVFPIFVNMYRVQDGKITYYFPEEWECWDVTRVMDMDTESLSYPVDTSRRFPLTMTVIGTETNDRRDIILKRFPRHHCFDENGGNLVIRREHKQAQM